MTRGCSHTQTRLDALTGSAVDAIVSGDGAGRITDWNPAAERMFGYSEAEIVGQPIERLIPLRYRAAHRAGVHRVSRGERGRILGSTVELAAVRKSGEEFPIELSLSTWDHDGERFFTGIIRDIGERKQIERRAQDSARELAAALRHLETMFAMVADLLEGQTLEGRYQLERRVRSDRVGALYEGMDLEHRTPVHVRVIRAPSPPDADLHGDSGDYPHAAAILDVGVSRIGLPYVVMEPLSGERLIDRLMRRRQIDLPTALTWCHAIARSLAAAHRRGDAHGMLCPEAIFLHDADTAAETIKLLDYEVSGLLRAGSAIAHAITNEQRPFCAPEVRRGEAPAAAADVYAFAALLGLLSGGTPPPDPATDEERSAWICATLPAELAALAELAGAALSSAPADRPTADAFVAALARAKEGYSGPGDQFTPNDYRPRDF